MPTSFCTLGLVGASILVLPAALGAQKPAAVATPGLVWETDLAAAHAAAARDGKPVVAYFTFET
ncbi:MAG: hypothetical protein R3F56_23380 [Planctomycetota bacterium]